MTQSSKPASPGHYRQIVETLQHLVWTCNAETGACEYLSPQWVEYTGIPAEEQLGYAWLEQLHPDDVEQTQKRWAEAAQSGTPFDTEFRIRRHDGVYRWFKTRAVLTEDPNDNTKRWVGTNTDVAQLYDAQESTLRVNRELEQRVNDRTLELQRSNFQLETVAKQLGAAQRIAELGSWELDVATNRVTWSDELFRVFGLDPSKEPPSYDIQQPLFLPESWDRLTRAIAGSIESGKGYSLTLHIVRVDGEHRTAVARAETLRNERGEVSRLVGTFQDISRVEETRAQLQSLTERLQLAAAAAGMGVWDWNVAENELVWDEGMHRLYGTTHDTFPGAYQAWSSSLHPDDAERAVSAINDTVKNGTPFDIVFRIIRTDGATRYMRALAKVYQSQEGKAQRVVGINLDVTDQQVAELTLRQQERRLRELNELLQSRTQQAESANTAKSRFVASVSHEIRTPLGAILGVIYLIKKTSLSGDQGELLATIERSAKTLLGMINDILDLSKIEAGQLSLDSSSFCIQGVGEELSGLMAGYALDKPIKICVEIDPQLPEFAIGDRVRLMQVLTNLAGNAIKFTERGKVTIRLKATATGEAQAENDNGRSTFRLRCEVQDTGRGIEPHQLSRVFDPFAQAEHTNATAGTGLGLAIVRELVTLMGGEVGVESEPGVGSTFSCEVLLSAMSRGEANTDGDTFCVAVVDEHEQQRISLVAAAQRLGWQAEAAASAQEVLSLFGERARTRRPLHAAIVNWKMPGMDGLQVIQELRGRPGGDRLAVVMATAHAPDTLRAHPQAALADAFLQKSVAPARLFDAVAQALLSRTSSTEMLSNALRYAQGVKRLPGVSLLVVDDNEVNLEIAEKVLTHEAAQVEKAQSGHEALKVLMAERKFDAVLMDVQMPEMDGIETVRRIREDLGLKSIPVIALTAGALATDRQRALEAGMTDFITKPFEPEQLVSKVRRRIENDRKTPLSISVVSHENPSGKSWPRIAGFDAEGARARLNGDLKLYRRLLGSLRDEVHLMLDVLDQEESPTSLASGVHRARGVAANVGARALSEAAGRAEVAIRQKLSTEAKEIASLREEAAKTLEALKVQVATDSSPKVLADLEPLPEEKRQRLTEMLRTHDLQALDLVEQNQGGLAHHLGSSRFSEFSGAVQRLDFAHALQLLDEQRSA